MIWIFESHCIFIYIAKWHTHEIIFIMHFCILIFLLCNLLTARLLLLIFELVFYLYFLATCNLALSIHYEVYVLYLVFRLWFQWNFPIPYFWMLFNINTFTKLRAILKLIWDFFLLSKYVAAQIRLIVKFDINIL